MPRIQGCSYPKVMLYKDPQKNVGCLDSASLPTQPSSQLTPPVPFLTKVLKMSSQMERARPEASARGRGREGWEARGERRAPESLQNPAERLAAANAKGQQRARSPVMG